MLRYPRGKTSNDQIDDTENAKFLGSGGDCPHCRWHEGEQKIELSNRGNEANETTLHLNLLCTDVSPY